MAKNDETFELIQAMSANEKRFFRLSSIQSGKETNYLRVFSAMDSIEEFDTEKVNRKLKGKKLNLSYEKNYLHKQLIRSLRHFYADSNSAIELQDILKSLEILYRKRLNAQCQKLISKGIEICKLYEQWNYHLELIDWQYRLYARTGNYKALAAYSMEGMREKEDVMQQIRLYSKQQEEIYFIYSVFQLKSGYMNTAEKKRFEQIRTNYSVSKQKQYSFRSNEVFHNAQTLCHHYRGDLKQAYLWSKAAQELYQKNPRFISDQPFRFFSAKGNIINRCLHLEKYTEALQYIDELKILLRNLSAFNLQEMQEEYQMYLLAWQARAYYKLDRREEALQIAKDFVQKISLKKLRVNLSLIADSYLARIYFYNGLFKESLRFVNRQIREGINLMQPDYIIFAYLLRLCIYAELKNYSLLDSHIGALKRYMKKNEVNDVFALRLIGLVEKLSSASEEKMQKKILKEAYEPLRKLVTPEMEQYEVVVDWVGG